MEKREAALQINKRLISDIRHILTRRGLAAAALSSFPLTPRRLASLTALNLQGRISGKHVKQTLDLVIAEDRDPEAILQERHWECLVDPAKIAETVRTVQEAEQAVFAEVRAAIVEGNLKRRHTLTAYLVGKVLAATGGRADPKIAGAQIEAAIGNGG